MKLLLILATILLGSTAYPSTIEDHWINFKTQYNKSYTDPEEEIKRFEIFTANLEKIQQHNELYRTNVATYHMALNQWGDLTAEEFLDTIKTHKQIGGDKHSPLNLEKRDVPDSIDWRDKGAVPIVENQGQYGSAAAFAAVGVLESANFIQHGEHDELIYLSIQEIADCVAGGCNGGLVDDVYNYVLEHGIAAAADYPDKNINDTCKRGDIPSALTVLDFVTVEQGSEEGLKTAVGSIGPALVQVDATQTWQFYSGGILYDPQCSSTLLNHALLAIGYGNEQGGDYWILKNSWGASWGENGFVRTARNKGNNCGIASAASYPELV